MKTAHSLGQALDRRGEEEGSEKKTEKSEEKEQMTSEYSSCGAGAATPICMSGPQAQSSSLSQPRQSMNGDWKGSVLGVLQSSTKQLRSGSLLSGLFSVSIALQ